jgi:magnesium chelatase family protein
MSAKKQLFCPRLSSRLPTFNSTGKNLGRCPCGFLLDGGKNESKACTCTAPQIRRYLSRISGPLLDRIDIHIEVPRLSSQELMGKSTGESSACVRQRVVAARKKQVDRMSGSGISCNAQMKAKGLRDYYNMDAATKDLLKAAFAQFSLSGRGYDRILKVSRTIADLEDSEMIQLHHVAEAINYRAFDRKLFV